MKKTALLIACMVVGMSLSAQVKNYITLWGDLGEASLLSGISDVQNGASLGVGGGIGVGYELYANRFLLDVGVGINVSHSAFSLNPYASTLPDQTDSEGDKFNYIFTLNDRQDAYTNTSLQIPLLLGAQLNRFYFLVGVKLDASLLVNTRVSTVISSEGEYPMFIDPFTGMPEHMFFNDYVLEQKGKVDFKTNVMASAEIGWRLGHIDNSTGFDVPKPKTLYRIGLFADYGIFDVHYRSNKPAVVLPETFNAENMTSDMAVNDILSTSQAQKIVNNLLVGVKFTVLFQLPEPKKCVFCNDDYTYLYR